jgi:F420-dependent oxidoreductase-like protein
MNVGIHIVSFTLPGGPAAIGPTLTEVARAAEEAGARNLSVMDHYLQLGGGTGSADEPMLEGYTTLGYLAAITSTVELQLLVTGVTYRHPGLLAKIVSTLDVLSGGRAMLGVGAAWYEREHHALGVRFPPLVERFERLEETVQIVHQMWSDDVGPYAGKHYQLGATVNSPQPLSRPHPPIMIGGGGETKTLRLGRQVCRRDQPLRRTQRRAGRGEGQVGRAARALRQRGHRLRPDPQDHPVRRTARTR